MNGRTERLKERTIGIEVFGRDPNYDTNLDPVVRVTAGEIRKRIAQYYRQAEHEGEVQIDLPSGCYVAEFRPPDAVAAAPEIALAAAPASKARKMGVAGSSLAAVAILVAAVYCMRPPAALDRFWAPVVAEPGSVLLSVGGPKQALPITRLQERSDPTDSESEISILNVMTLDRVSFSTALTLSRLVGFLQAKRKPVHVERGISTSLEDLRGGPAVLIGGFNNEWTLRLVSPLRFTLERDSTLRIDWIQDRDAPADRRWTVDINRSYLKMTEDYALISRVWDATTERIVVVAAGLTNYGTTAAGEFLTEPSYMEAVAKRAPANWQKKNMQFVLATQVINGNSGPPHVVAAQFW